MSDRTPEDWTEEQNALFDRLYRHMLANQDVFVHPEAPSVDGAHWKTTCWNAAWMAVMFSSNCLPIVCVDEDDRVIAFEPGIQVAH